MTEGDLVALATTAKEETNEYNTAQGDVATAKTARDAAQTELDSKQGTATTEKDEAITALQAVAAAANAQIEVLQG